MSEKPRPDATKATSTPTQGAASDQQKAPADDTAKRVMREIMSSNWIITVLAILSALVLGAILVAITDQDVQRTAGYLFARPGDFFGALGHSFGSTFSALFQGAVFDFGADTWQRAVKPLTETLTLATPLILAGLGLAVAFQAGVFNIGAQGQVILGATAASYIGFRVMVPGVHLLLAVVVGMAAGALWAGIAGVLKAKTGAHEVITTIMLNWIAVFLLSWLLDQTFFKREGQNFPKSPPSETMFWKIWPGDPSPFRLHWGFILALVMAAAVWFLMNRTTWGFRFRAVGENPASAKTAGMSVSAATIGVMLIAGGLAGLAGANQILGTEASLTAGVAGSLGFDAITVALLGRSKPWGVVGAGILFGAFSAGGRILQSATGTPIQIVLVLQAVVVLLVAAPPLVRAIFHLPAPRPKSYAKEAQA